MEMDNLHGRFCFLYHFVVCSYFVRGGLLAFMLCFMVSCANKVLQKMTADKAKVDKIDFFIVLNFLEKYGF